MHSFSRKIISLLLPYNGFYWNSVYRISAMSVTYLLLTVDLVKVSQNYSFITSQLCVTVCMS